VQSAKPGRYPDVSKAAQAAGAAGVNPFERAVRAVDMYQQRHTPIAFVVAVIRKFGDDRGGTLATSLTYVAFVAVFPLLLLFVTILGFVLGSNQDAEDAVLRSMLVDFPILGDQLVRSLGSLRGSGLALAVGLAGLAWGASGSPRPPSTPWPRSGMSLAFTGPTSSPGWPAASSSSASAG
jgi:Virulence factor BrkB